VRVTSGSDHGAIGRPGASTKLVAMSASHLPIDPGPMAVGTWSGGRFMHFGEPIDDERFLALITPDETIRTVITADVYGAGEADAMLGRALNAAERTRDRMCVVGAIGHDFYDGERNGAKGFPRFTDPALRGPDGYADYLRMATERSLERCGTDRFDLLLLHNPDRIGYTSEAVWNGMAALRDAGLTRMIGVAPGPANGFTLDVIDCLERFGDVIDWAMIILGPLEPWPGELVLGAASEHRVRVITRVVDYGGLLFDDVHAGAELARGDHRGFRPAGWIEGGRARLEVMRPIAQRTGLTAIQLACQWNLAHDSVQCVVPTLIQEAGPDARPVEDKRAELAALPDEPLLSAEDVEAIRRAGDNTGSMALKGANPAFTGDPQADRWAVDQQLAEVAQRWRIEPARDLAHQGLA
jgi:aryl-alcohol dehydrogenase-like predicted oxidoreductase